MENVIAMAKRETVDVVADKIRSFQNNGELHFPPNYSPENALKSAWLKLQATQDKDKNPVLSVCTRESIANALLDMVIQGLNPSKNQCYFIAYGKNLVCQRSYLGTMAVTKTLTGAQDIYAEIVYKGDDFQFQIIRGRKQVTKHVQTMETMSSGQIVGAYCTLVLEDGTERTEFMTIDEIRKSWSMSKNNPNSESSVHSKFPQEMAKKTVINRACKLHLNSSDDSSLMMQVARRAGDSLADAEVEHEIAENANSEPIDIDYQFSGDSSDEEHQGERDAEPVAAGAPF